MATDTAPAAVPGPGDEPTSSPAAGLLASLVAPVAPARPTFDLTPTAAAEQGVEQPVTGASSAAYHGEEETAEKGRTTTRAEQKKSVWRAWMLAGAARWGRGGGTHNKRLDLAKARANSQQVKENRQVTVNRSGGLLGKSPSGSGSGGGKWLRSKGNSPVKGPRNSSGNAHGLSSRNNKGRPGSGSGGGRGPGGGGSSGRSGGGTSPKGSGSGDGAGERAPKQRSNGGASKGVTPAGDTGRSRKNSTQTPSGSSGKTTGGKGSGSGSPGGGNGPKGKGGAGKQGAAGKNGTPGSGSSTGTKGDANGRVTLRKAASDAVADRAHNRLEARRNDPARPVLSRDRKDKTSGQKAEKDNKGNQKKPEQTKNGAAPNKTVDTLESRQTGYRDGSRAALAAAHVKAYRDGVKDGWKDTTEAAERDKARLDKAHEQRKAEREKEQQVSAAGSSADYHQPQPIGVKEVTASHVILGDGAAKDSMSRGEVRSLKAFERRLSAKSESMARIGEETKGLKAHAEDQAKKATRLLEAAKSVKGGEKLVGRLAKLEEDAKVQAGKAEDINKRAARGAEGCRVVLANAETRYGGIYKAVVDSDETAPAELAFYQG